MSAIPTPPVTALRGLVEALRRIGQVENDTGLVADERCAECGGWVNRDWTVAAVDGHVSCGTDCPGRIARAALAPWESRGPLNADVELCDSIYRLFDLTKHDISVILDLVDRALTGGGQGG